MERTFIAIKPDGVRRGLIGDIIRRFEKKGFKIIGLKMLHMDNDLASKHYEEHIGKPFFDRLVAFITSGPIIALVIEGPDAVQASRRMMGATDPREAERGSIRADYAIVKESNIIHGSDSLESAKREIGLYFTEQELCTNWSDVAFEWIED